MMRLTKEREEEIKKSDYIGTDDAYGAYCAVGELLAEIDALRAEILAEVDRSENERDALKAWDKQHNRDVLRLLAENDKLKTNQLFEVSCTKLFEENQKLRERIENALAVKHSHACSSCGLSDEEYARAEGFNDAVERFRKTLKADDEGV